MRILISTAFTFVFSLVAASNAFSMSTSALRCLKLAGSPADTGMPAGISGVAFGDVRTEEAIAACIEAMRETDASDKALPRIAYTLGRVHHAAGEHEKAKMSYEVSAESGFPLALNNLASLYYDGAGVPQDFHKAYALFAKAGDQGLTLSHRNAVRMIVDGELGEPDWEKAAAHWRALAAVGDSDAAFDLASKIAEGTVAPLSPKEMSEAYRLAADAGHLIAAQEFSKWLEAHATTTAEQQLALDYAYQMLDIAVEASLDEEFGWILYQWNAAQRIRIVRDKFGLSARDEAEDNRLKRDFSGKQKRFTVPITCAEQTDIPFNVFIWDWSRDYPQTDLQAEWIEKARGCAVPDDVAETFKKVFAIAARENVSFVDLAVYSFGTAGKEKKVAEAKPEIVFGEFARAAISESAAGKTRPAQPPWLSQEEADALFQDKWFWLARIPVDRHHDWVVRKMNTSKDYYNAETYELSGLGVIAYGCDGELIIKEKLNIKPTHEEFGVASIVSNGIAVTLFASSFDGLTFLQVTGRDEKSLRKLLVTGEMATLLVQTRDSGNQLREYSLKGSSASIRKLDKLCAR